MLAPITALIYSEVIAANRFLLRRLDYSEVTQHFQLGDSRSCYSSPSGRYKGFVFAIKANTRKSTCLH